MLPAPSSEGAFFIAGALLSGLCGFLHNIDTEPKRNDGGDEIDKLPCRLVRKYGRDRIEKNHQCAGNQGDGAEKCFDLHAERDDRDAERKEGKKP